MIIQDQTKDFSGEYYGDRSQLKMTNDSVRSRIFYSRVRASTEEAVRSEFDVSS